MGLLFLVINIINKRFQLVKISIFYINQYKPFEVNTILNKIYLGRTCNRTK